MFTTVSIDTTNPVTTQQVPRNHYTPYTVARVPFERLLPLCATKLGSLQNLIACVLRTTLLLQTPHVCIGLDSRRTDAA
jgi:hypothetical protein